MREEQKRREDEEMAKWGRGKDVKDGVKECLREIVLGPEEDI